MNILIKCVRERKEETTKRVLYHDQIYNMVTVEDSYLKFSRIDKNQLNALCASELRDPKGFPDIKLRSEELNLKCKGDHHLYKIDINVPNSHNALYSWGTLSIRTWVHPFIKDLDQECSDAGMCFNFSNCIRFDYSRNCLVILYMGGPVPYLEMYKDTKSFCDDDELQSDSSNPPEEVDNQKVLEACLSYLTFQLWEGQDV